MVDLWKIWRGMGLLWDEADDACDGETRRWVEYIKWFLGR